MRVRRALIPWADGAVSSRPAGRCAVVALVLTLLVMGLLVLNDDYRGPDDDLGIAMVLSGLYPDGGQCLFTNAVLNGAIYQLNMAFPALNWFLVVERLAAAVAFFVLGYLLLRHVPLGTAAAVLGFVAYFIMPQCTLGANFTVVAALCVMAGELALCVGIARRRISPCIAGGALVILGFMWRALVLLLSAPFLALALGALLLRCGKGHPEQLKGLLWRALAGLVAVGLAVGAALAWDKAVWNDEHWAPWQEFNDARYSLVDYPMKPYKEVKDELASLGVSKSDYWLMTHWITADPDYFTTERLAQVAAVAAEPPADRSLPTAFLSEAKHMVKSPLLTIALAFAAVATLLVGRRKTAVVVALSLAGAFAACVAFHYTGRLPDRVEYAVWLFSLLPLAVSLVRRPLPLDATSSPRAEGHQVLSAALGILLALLCAVGLGVKWGPGFNVDRIDQFAKESAFAQSGSLVQRFTEPGTVYVWDTTTFIHVERQLLYRHLPPASFMDSTVLMGGWTQGSPLVAAHNASLGIKSPMEALLERPDTYFVTHRKQALKYVTRYMREHYDKNVSYDIVEEVSLPDKGADPLLVVRFQAH